MATSPHRKTSKTMVQISQSTQSLLNRQREMIAEPKPEAINYGMPIYKSSKQIKMEKYDLRHTKNFMRVLKMHSIQPRFLRESSEPPRVFMKDYSIDVNAHAKKLLADIKTRDREKREWDSTSDTAETESELGTELNKMDKLDATVKQPYRMRSGTAVSSSLKFGRPGAKEAPRQQSAAVIAKRKALKRRNRPDDPLPTGAKVIIDDACTKEIKSLEDGLEINKTDLRNQLRQGMLNMVNKHALQDMKKFRQRLSMLKNSADIDMKQKVGDEFLKASQMLEQTQKMTRHRPHDKIVIMDSNRSASRGRGLRQGQESGEKEVSGGEPVTHKHYVKMSFEQLPANLQEAVSQKYGDNRFESQRTSIAFGGSDLTSQLPLSTVDDSMATTMYSKPISNATQSIPLKSKNRRTTMINSKFDRGEDSKFSNSIGIISSSQMNELYNAENAGKLRKRGLSAATNKFDHASASVQHQSMPQHNQYSNQLGDASQTKQQIIAQKRKSNFVAHSNNMKSMFNVKVNMQGGRGASIQHKSQFKTIKEHPYSHVSVKSTLSSSASCQDSQRPKREKRPDNYSISNITQSQQSYLKKKMSCNKSYKSSSIAPMVCQVQKDQTPKKLADGSYLVQQSFQYKQAKTYKIDFARPAIFISGCLTCGNENANVENYGERYCCSSCQKSLQTPDGDQVTLRTSHDGRFIIAQAWRYSLPLHDVEVDIDDLRIRGGHRCHATFSGEKGDIIVLLDEVREDLIYK